MNNHCEHCATLTPEGQRFCSMRCQDKPDIQSANLEKMITELIASQVQMDPVMAEIINEHIDELLMYEEST